MTSSVTMTSHDVICRRARRICASCRPDQPPPRVAFCAPPPDPRPAEKKNIQEAYRKGRLCRVSDPYSFDTDPDPPQHFRLNTDPDPDPIRIQGLYDRKFNLQLKKNIKIF